MINSALYSHYNSMQKSDARYVIDNYFHLLKWRPDENILDVGTGDGHVLLEFVLHKIPTSFQKLIALDIDEEMLKHVRCKNHPRIELLQMDIATTSLPLELRSNFDHIFSFYCLQLLKEQRQAFENLYDMLTPGGEMLVSIVANHLVFDVYEKLASCNKWKPFMGNFSDVGPYNRSVNAVKEMEGILHDVGFINYKCELISNYHIHDIRDFWLWASAINPFIKNIPEKQMKQYKEEYMKEVRKNRRVTIEMNNGKEENIRVTYQFLVVIARKH